MNRGAWHQFGWNSQIMILDELSHDTGAGVILSPRDLNLPNTEKYATQYSETGASVLYDPQWHVPSFTNDKFASYPTNKFRDSVGALGQISDSDLKKLTSALLDENNKFGTDAIIAPAVVYEAGRADIFKLNSRLHRAAQYAGELSKKPVYGTVVLGESITGSKNLTDEVLSDVTSLKCDGWYFAFEFPAERIPSDTSAVYNCLQSILTLSATGNPVLHAYAGPMGILSFSAGATGAAIGPSQKQWRFCRERWEHSDDSGGNGRAPQRYFSRNLWGTIVTPDEIVLLNSDLKSQVYSESPFAPIPIPPQWRKGESERHMVYTICKGMEDVVAGNSLKACRDNAYEILNTSIELHDKIRDSRIVLKDDTACYQANWKAALGILEQNHEEDFDYLDLISG